MFNNANFIAALSDPLRVKCNACSRVTSKQKTCKECGGSGFVGMCSVCNGAGAIGNFPDMKACPLCEGRGFNPEADLLNHLAHKIARISALSDIESHSTFQVVGKLRWYDISEVDQAAKPYVQDAVRYLCLRGLLVRHPSNSSLVRFKRPSALSRDKEA